MSGLGLRNELEERDIKYAEVSNDDDKDVKEKDSTSHEDLTHIETKAKASSFREDVAACITRQLLEEQEKVRRLTEELTVLRNQNFHHHEACLTDPSFYHQELVEDSYQAVDQVLNCIERSLGNQETENERAHPKVSPTIILERAIRDSSGERTICKIKRGDLQRLLKVHKNLQEELTDSKILIASLREKEKKLSTILEEERSRCARKTHLSPGSSERRSRLTNIRSPMSTFDDYEDSSEIVANLEQELAEEREKCSQLLDNQRRMEGEVIRLERKVQEQQVDNSKLKDRYEKSMSTLQEEYEEMIIQNSTLKEQYKRLYNFVNRTA